LRAAVFYETILHNHTLLPLLTKAAIHTLGSYAQVLLTDGMGSTVNCTSTTRGRLTTAEQSTRTASHGAA
jgi:hypothetical protein